MKYLVLFSVFIIFSCSSQKMRFSSQNAPSNKEISENYLVGKWKTEKLIYISNGIKDEKK